jgi:hypothetical protein
MGLALRRANGMTLKMNRFCDKSMEEFFSFRDRTK